MHSGYVFACKTHVDFELQHGVYNCGCCLDSVYGCVPGVPYFSNPDTITQITFDLDRDQKEVELTEQDNYYASPPTIHVLNMDIECLGKYLFKWRECEGGKSANEILSCLEFATRRY